jgi:hypothetical protein
MFLVCLDARNCILASETLICLIALFQQFLVFAGGYGTSDSAPFPLDPVPALR